MAWTVSNIPDLIGKASNGARAQLRAATDPDAKGGEFYGPRLVNNGPAVRPPIMRRLGLDKAIKYLWQVSESLTSTPLEFSTS